MYQSDNPCPVSPAKWRFSLGEDLNGKVHFDQMGANDKENLYQMILVKFTNIYHEGKKFNGGSTSP